MSRWRSDGPSGTAGVAAEGAERLTGFAANNADERAVWAENRQLVREKVQVELPTRPSVNDP